MKKQSFGPLYAKASNGKTKEWSCVVIQDGDVTINVSHGYIDGKKATDSRVVKGKNLGKTNETSPWAQGLAEAESKRKKKLDEGYMEDKNDVATTEIELPMLANKYMDRSHYVEWPCYAQPKLNGVRCVTKMDGGSDVRYVSRQGKFFSTLEHLDDNVTVFLDEVGKGDGEIFQPEWTFQEVIRAVKKTRENTDELEYWIYDVVDTNKSFEGRKKAIKEFFDKHSDGKNSLGFRKFGNLVEVPTVEIANQKEFKIKHKQFTEEWNFEGTIVRNKNGMYMLKHRSNDLLKYKDFVDAEYEIVGGKEAEGNDAGTVVFTCKTLEGKEFDVRPKGSREIRREWFKDLDSLVGKQLTIRYQNLSEDGIPIFPVGIEVRDYE